MIFLSTYRNKRRWIAAAGMTIWLMSAYVWMLDEIPGTVCVSDGQPLNITEGGRMQVVWSDSGKRSDSSYCRGN